MRKQDEPWDAEWREVQDRRYDKGFYPGSGKIHPFFRGLARADTAFGVQLLLLSVVLVAIPVTGLVDRQFFIPLLIPAVIFGIGGISHIRNANHRRRG